MRIVLLGLTLVFLLITGFFYQNKALSLHFVDEEDNMILGDYLLKGDKLYSDLFSHHQPFAYVLSAGIQKVFQPDSIFLLIKRHREVVITLSILFSVILVFRFGVSALLTVSVYELTKIFLLGNLFLSESLVVYPLLYLFFVVWSQKKLNKLETIFIGFLFAFCFFTIAPLWPVLLLLLGILHFKAKFDFKTFALLIIGALPILLICLFFSSIRDYFFNVFYINFKYYIPSDGTKPSLINLLKSLVSPYLVFVKGVEKTPILHIIQTITVVFTFFSIILLRAKKYWLVFLSFIVLMLANIRFVQPGLDYYRGFHLLPWFAILISSTFLMAGTVWKSNKNKILKIASIFFISILFFVAFQKSKDVLFRKVDLNNSWYINYSAQFSLGEAVRIMREDGEALFVAPDEWLIYWQADIEHASKMINYYAWMTHVPELSNEVNKTFEEYPPVYFYCKCPEGYINPNFYEGYEEMIKDGRSTSLFVKTKKLDSLNSEQTEKLKFFGFKI